MIAINGNIIVRPDEPEEKYKGLVKPDVVTSEKPETGTVISSDSPKFKPGDRVVFGKFVAVRVKGLLIMKADEALAKIN